MARRSTYPFSSMTVDAKRALVARFSEAFKNDGVKVPTDFVIVRALLGAEGKVTKDSIDFECTIECDGKKATAKLSVAPDEFEDEQ
jgi:hypothetical protein